MHEYWILGAAGALGFYMAWNIGANDVANAFGTSVGSGALTLRKALLVAAIFEFSGAFFVGAHVTETVRKGIVDPMAFQGDPDLFLYGMLSALLAASVWINIATYLGLPVSTTHSIVGAIVGFGLASGAGSISWAKVIYIVLSWIISPIAGGIIAYLVFLAVQRRVLSSESPVASAVRFIPVIAFLTFSSLALSMIYKGLKPLRLNLPPFKAALISLAVGAAGMIAFYAALRRFRKETNHEYDFVERNFKYLQVLTACYDSFAHGSNDVANAVGPVAAIFAVVKTGKIAAKVPVSPLLLAVGGLGIVIGLATWGYKVIETIGRRITELTPSRGFVTEFASATVVLFCSKIGLPVSTTHAQVGCTVGVGLARGIAAINLRVVRNIIFSWIATLPISAAIAAGIFELLVHLLR